MTFLRVSLLRFLLISFSLRIDGELYAGTVSDFSSLDPLIYKEPFRTEQYDQKHLNGINIKLMMRVSDQWLIIPFLASVTAPNFVHSMADGDYVYFFFRETAVEYINCGKV